jgi:hypothetical protein
MTPSSVVNILRVSFEIRIRIEGDREHATVIELGGYRSAGDVPEEYRVALLKWLQEGDR